MLIENGICSRWIEIWQLVTSYYALYDNAEHEKESSTKVLKLGSKIDLLMLFRGPIFGLIIGVSISMIVFLMEYSNIGFSILVFIKLLYNITLRSF